MPGQARHWRADGGYQDAPEPPTPVPVCLPAMYCYPGYGPGYGGGYNPWMCQPYYQCPPYQQYQNYVEGPVGIAGLYTPPPPYGNLSPPPPPPAPPKEEKKDGEQKDKRCAPPKLPEGANYLFDKDNTMLHVFSKAAPIWTEKYHTEKLKFKMFQVSVNFTIKMLIENVLKKGGDDCKGWAATEAVERGGGIWDKGSTIEYDSDKAKGSLKSMGWSVKRGDVLPPVWVVVHKADFK
ncbi:hypothetical protein LTR37_010614 [Vermiconidia calcicola]|uniref:Uncharacterized protein n=1 Tax=Vermiconidia calcicola TaxID=1690605 RepID=A0ACC3N7G8_9PEZI|nr:hypothetical protein LTR37_010614 [Vermiconidia calcicola]